MSNDSGSVLLALLTGAAIGAGVYDTVREKGKTATDELTKTAQTQKEDFERRLDESISNMSYKADDIIAGLERKLVDLKKKNAQLQK